MRSFIGSLTRRGAPRADSPVPLAGRSSQAGIFSQTATITTDMLAQMETYGSNGVVFPIVNRLATSTASAEWKLYRKAVSGLDEDRVEVTSHAALDLWNKPNKFMTRAHLMEAVQQHVDLVGEGDILLGKIGKTIIELWPCRPDLLEPVKHPYKFLTGWIYTGPNNEKVPVELSEIVRMVMPSPLDMYRGQGPIQSILHDLDGQRYGREWQASFYRNSAEPGGIIQVDRRLGDDEFREMSARWAEQHRGVSKAHRVAIIEAGAQWVDRKYTQKDMQFAEMSTVSRDTALIAFGFPKAMLGIAEDVNRANAEAGEYMFAKWLVKVRLDRWREMLNSQLLPMFPRAEGLEFDYESPVPENAETEMQALTAKWGAIAQAVPLGFDPAEMLEALGLPAIAFKAPEPPPAPVIAPPGQRPEEQPTEDPKTRALFRTWLAEEIDAAMKWEAVEHVDESTCEKCKANDGKLYRNREDAYADYPDGKGFKDCIGAEFGNECRGTVRKRKSGS